MIDEEDVEDDIVKNRPSRGRHIMPVEDGDFFAKSALFLPKEAQNEKLSAFRKVAKAEVDVAGNRDKKSVQQQYDTRIAYIQGNAD